jgi:hypothetical protein
LVLPELDGENRAAAVLSRLGFGGRTHHTHRLAHEHGLANLHIYLG